MLNRTRNALFQILALKPFWAPKNVFILSHQRSRSTLLAHILGSSESINGYYEGHHSYHDNKSIYRARFLYAGEHQLKPKAQYFLDKVLHDDNVINKDIIARPCNRLVFLLRDPIYTVDSLVNMKVKMSHSTIDESITYAIDYYTSRLKTLIHMWDSAPAIAKLAVVSDDLIQNAEETLEKLQRFLELPTPLTTNYNKFKYTGVSGAGDPSENITSLQLINKKRETTLELTSDQLSSIQNTYNQALRTMNLKL